MKTIEGITMEWLQARVIEDGDCLIWQGCMSQKVNPHVNIGGKTMSMRRVMWVWKNKREIPKDRRVSPKCGNPCCVNPDHMAALPINQIHKGKPHSLMRRAAVANGHRARSKFSDDVIAAVRVSEGPLAATAEQYGMDITYVSLIRKNKARKDFTNPYLQLVSHK